MGLRIRKAWESALSSNQRPFADHAHHFNSGECCAGRTRRKKPPDGRFWRKLLLSNNALVEHLWPTSCTLRRNALREGRDYPDRDRTTHSMVGIRGGARLFGRRPHDERVSLQCASLNLRIQRLVGQSDDRRLR